MIILLYVVYFLFRYEHSHGRKMSTAAAAQLMSVTLYYRRFFPYYAFCMIAGLDEEGMFICSNFKRRQLFMVKHNLTKRKTDTYYPFLRLTHDHSWL